MKISGLDKLLKELDQAQKALSRLDGTLATVEFYPNQPASIQAAISKMDGQVDACVSTCPHNKMVKELAESVKASFADQIRERAA